MTNSGEPGLLDWTLDTTLVFGGDETGPATFYHARPALVDVDSRPAEIDSRVVRLLSVRGEDTIPLIPGKPGHSTTAYYPRCNFTFSIHQPLAPRIRWSHWGDRVAVSAWGGFRIDVLEDHRLVRSVRWVGVGEREPSSSEAEALSGSGLGGL